MKRGFAFEKLFKKMVANTRTSLRPTVSFYTTKPSLVQPGKHRLKKLAWQPKLSHRPLQAVATPLIRTCLGVILILLIYFLFGSRFFILENLVIQGNRLVDAAIIEKTVFPNGFHKTNALLFNEAKANAQVMTLAQVKAVNFQKQIFQHQLLINIEEHETSLIWQTNGEKFLVNRAGVVYDIAPPESPLIVVEDLKNVPVNLKQQILTTDFIEFVNFVAANLSRKTKVNVRQMIVPETTFELEVVTNEGWKIIFDTTKSPDTQLNNLAKILQGGAQPRQYVDLRILDRVYYK
ncbi:MAG: FtsQ-type POTRA domain-containing protein [Patescibacteria group bacterium]|jgi:cell division septal protein FtsQ